MTEALEQDERHRARTTGNGSTRRELSAIPVRGWPDGQLEGVRPGSRIAF